LSLSACAKHDEATNAAATETVTLNDEGDASLDNSATLDGPALGNDTTPLANTADEITAPPGNGG
jgi:hypothetical protein